VNQIWRNPIIIIQDVGMEDANSNHDDDDNGIEDETEIDGSDHRKYSSVL
jgi:hypothetical protein